MQLHFEWDPRKAESNFRKHGVSFAEAAEVFHDPLALTLFDEDHSAHEERWVTLGQTSARRLVVVAHTWRDSDTGSLHVRIISARPATSHEARHHEG
ncbi:MAG: BrnT family toxin [Pseudomonadota bacterium]